MRHLRIRFGSWVGAATLLAGMALPGAGDPGDGAAGAPKGRLADQEALRPFAPLVGSWKGTGQVRRGSNQGAWTETADWAWKLAPDSARLEVTVGKGKFLRSATLAPDPAHPGAFVLDAALVDGSQREFRGAAGDGPSARPVAFLAEGTGPGVRRITLATPNDARSVLTFEAVPAPGASPSRLGEVGSTRAGAAFAAGEAGPKCIVTGGRGTMQVTHAGKTYYVCCSGCRDLFRDDPAAVLAEAARKDAAKP